MTVKEWLTRERIAADGQSAKAVTITPDIASMLLDSMPSSDNDHQRREIRGHATRLGSMMTCGDWIMDGTTIKIDRNFRMIDGQHRCLASKRSGVSFLSLVVAGLDPRSKETANTGERLAHHHLLTMRGIVNATLISSVAKRIYHYETTGIPCTQGVKTAPSHIQLNRVLERHGCLNEFACREMHNPVLSPSMATWLRYATWRSDPYLSGEFMSGLSTGLNLPNGSPILQLRNRLISYKSSKASPMQREPAALSIKAWNAFACGSKISVLRIGKSEAFPALLGFTPEDSKLIGTSLYQTTGGVS